MLHVEIEVPALEKKYEFSLNENAKVKVIIEEIAAVIAQYEQKTWKTEGSPLLLCDCGRHRILPLGKTLYECRTKQGSQLMLI